MMGWKDLPYWLKGGLIGVIVAFFSSLIVQLVELNNLGIIREIFAWLNLPGLIIAAFTGFFRIDFFGGFGSTPAETLKSIIVVFIFNVLFYFLIGALVGAIVGKVKSKNKNKKNRT